MNFEFKWQKRYLPIKYVRSNGLIRELKHYRDYPDVFSVSIGLRTGST